MPPRAGCGAWLEVLADGDHIGACRAQIAEQRANLLFGFASPSMKPDLTSALSE